MYNIFYQFPIPVINLIIGLGSGKTKLDCSACAEEYTDPESGEKTGYKAGEASQWYTSFGFPIIPLFDLHLSYRSVSSKIETTTGSDKGKKDDVGGNVMGLGIGFNF